MAVVVPEDLVDACGVERMVAVGEDRDGIVLSEILEADGAFVLSGGSVEGR